VAVRELTQQLAGVRSDLAEAHLADQEILRYEAEPTALFWGHGNNVDHDGTVDLNEAKMASSLRPTLHRLRESSGIIAADLSVRPPPSILILIAATTMDCVRFDAHKDLL
jgi:hypothetical protein